MLSNIKDEDLGKIKKVLDGIKPPQRKTKINATNYIEFFNKNEHYTLLQFCSFDEYDKLITDLINHYPNDKKNIVRILLSSFYPFIQTNTYISYIEFLDKMRIDFNSFENEINIIHNSIIDFYTYYFDNKFSDLKIKTHGGGFSNLMSFFNIKEFNFNEFCGKTGLSIKEMDEAIYEDKIPHYKLFGQHMVDVSVLNYYVARSVKYRKLNREMLDISLNKSKEVIGYYFNRIKKQDCFIPSLNRISSLVSSYHNVKIKDEIENRGKNNIKKYVDDYLKDMLFLYSDVMKYLDVGEKKKFLLNYIEIINFYNLAKIDLNAIRVDVSNDRLSLKKFYSKLIYEIIYELNFINIFNMSPLTTLNVSPHTLSEIGMFISSISLVEQQSNEQHKIFSNSFAKHFQEYEEQNFLNAFFKETNSVANLNYIWRD
ncbi:MAG: hypothetical protein ACOCP4_02250 [Candidatus Woesearchaeota archaeon]